MRCGPSRPQSRSSPSTIHRSTPCRRPSPLRRNPIRRVPPQGLPSRPRRLRAIKATFSEHLFALRRVEVHTCITSRDPGHVGIVYLARLQVGNPLRRVLKTRRRSRPAGLWPSPSSERQPAMRRPVALRCEMPVSVALSQQPPFSRSKTTAAASDAGKV